MIDSQRATPLIHLTIKESVPRARAPRLQELFPGQPGRPGGDDPPDLSELLALWREEQRLYPHPQCTLAYTPA